MDGNIVYNKTTSDDRYPIIKRVINSDPFDIHSRLLENIDSLPTGVSILEVSGADIYESIRTVIIVDKNYSNRFSYFATQSNSTPSFSSGMYVDGVWYS